MNKNRFCISVLMGALLALSPVRSRATITVDAANAVRQIPEGIGGTNIQAHDNYFATDRDGISYQSNLGLSGIGLVRTVTYPDFKATSHALSYFDDNVSKIIAQGAKPLFVLYLKPGSAFLKADGSPGGTVESNIVYLVNHYKAAPYNLTIQYWELHNEPDLTVDYQMTKEAYAAAFNSIHNALVTAGIRGNVILCGPATSNDYGWGVVSNGIMDYFLDHCKDAVDVVTRHIYIEDTDDMLLNNMDRIERQWNVTQSVGSAPHGEHYLQQTMDAKGVPSSVMTGVTEFNIGSTTAHGGGHTLVSGLWNLIALKYAIYNPRSGLTTGFVYDAYGTQFGGYGYYDASKQRDAAWWAHYIHGRLTGVTALSEATTNAKLVTCATRDANYLYLEVINRDVTNAITETVTVNNASVGLATVYQLSATQNTLLTGTSSSYGTGFSYTFPSKSATIFRYRFNPLIGFESGEGYTLGSIITQYPLPWSGNAPDLFRVAAVGNGTSQGILSAPKTGVSIAAYNSINHNAVAADFGGDTQPVTAGYTGLVAGSIDLAITEPASTQDATLAWFVRFGDTGQFELFLRANGCVQIRSTAGDIIARNGSGGNFVLGSSYKTISFVMDYAAQTAQVWVDGVAQTTSAGSLDIPWQGSPVNAKFARFLLQNNVANTDAHYSRIKVDNLNYYIP